jgi:beta-lactamase regulating signal transducer with metallopeptidase domain
MSSATMMFSYLVQTSLAVSVLIGLVLLIRRPFAKAFGQKTAYVLWAIPMARLVMPPVPADWTLFGALHFGGGEAAPPTSFLGDPVLVSEFVFSSVGPSAPVVIEKASFWSQMLGSMPPLLPTLMVLWAVSALFVFGRLMTRQLGTARLIAVEAKDAGPLLQTLAVDVAQTIGFRSQSVSVRTSLISSGPLVAGLVRPIILLPAWFEDDYTPEQQRLAIMHEMMHVKRGDLWALLGASVAIALQWFNPLAWIALSKFRLDQEAACDADVLSVYDVSPHAYGATLVQAVRKSGPVAQPVHAASLPLNHALYERIDHMRTPLPTTKRRKAGLLLTTGVGLAGLFLSACAVSHAQDNEHAGAPAADAETRVRAVVIDREHIETRGSEDRPTSRVRVIRRVEGGDGKDGEHNVVFLEGGDGSAHSAHSSAIFVGTEGAGEMPEHAREIAELAREFAEETRRLNAAPGDNSAELEALRSAFEAEVESRSEHLTDGVGQVRIMRLGEGAAWTGDIDAGEDCPEGRRKTRTIVIDRDGEREERVMTICGPGSVEIDTDAIMRDLRASGQLTEERLAEVEVKLAEAKAKLAALDFSGALEMDFDIEVDEDEIDIEIED